jgi:predicted SAM-dependent methyltransferase
MLTMTITRVNLGCGPHRLSGYIGVDFNKDENPDLVHDINQSPLPFLCDEILAEDVLEHLTEQGLVNACLSLKPGGLLHGKVPHYQYRGAYAEYQHQRWISSETFQQTRSIKPYVIVEKIVVTYSIFGYMWTMPNWFVAAHEKMAIGLFPPTWVLFWMRRKSV